MEDWVCQDCYFFIVNGDLPEDSEDEARVLRGVGDLNWVPNGPSEDEEEGADYMEFSNSMCDCCGTYLAGSRHRVAILDNDDENTPDPNVLWYDTSKELE